ncbi:MAG: acetolactate decarboxylase [Cryomorphaceae bacterium]
MNFRFLCFWVLLFAAPGSLQAQKVHTAGKAKNVMTGADLSAHAHLDSLMRRPGMIALGPLENLRGEITVLDGIPFVSTVINGGVSTIESADVAAPFLAYAYVEEWERISASVRFDGLRSIESFIDSIAQASGINTEVPFPFVLNASWREYEYHVIMRDTTEKIHSHEAHKRAKVRFYENDTPADLVGFFSRHHEGVFTHKGQFIHMHVLTTDRTRTGHLDGIGHSGTITVSLPKKLIE